MALVTLKIDGREVTVPQGTTILEAAKRIGIEIPHYCYHPKLEVVGSCRMCQVEVEKAPKLVISCATSVTEGMVVHTRSPNVEKARKAVLEFFLLNHPLDCPICDKGGECPLQDYTLRYGPGESRFIEEKIKRIKHKIIGPYIIFDAERCILCTRCVRFCRDVAGTGELGVFNRGDRSEIGLFPGKSLDNKFSGNVIDLCPVGALTSRDYRFRSRPWDLIKQVDTICALCSRGCNITVDVRHLMVGQEILRIRPRINEEVNSYWICDEGRFGFHFNHDNRRLREPLWWQAPRGQKLVPLPWGEAIDRTGALLRGILERDGQKAIGVIASSRLTNEEALLVWRLFREALGTPNLDYRTRKEQGPEGDFSEDFLRRADKTPNSLGLYRAGIVPGDGGMDGRAMIAATAEGRLKALFLIEEDLAHFEEDLPLWDALSRLDLLVVMDIFMTETGRFAHFLFPTLSPYEKKGTFTNFQGKVQEVRPVLSPPGDIWPLEKSLKELARTIGLTL